MLPAAFPASPPALRLRSPSSSSDRAEDDGARLRRLTPPASEASSSGSKQDLQVSYRNTLNEGASQPLPVRIRAPDILRGTSLLQPKSKSVLWGFIIQPNYISAGFKRKKCSPPAASNLSERAASNLPEAVGAHGVRDRLTAIPAAVGRAAAAAGSSSGSS